MNVVEIYEIRDAVMGVDQGDLEGDFVKNVRYLNYTNEIVKIRDRSGFIIHLNPAYSPSYTGKDGLVIRVEMQFNHNTAKLNYERIIAKPQSERDVIELEFAKRYSQTVHQLNRRMNFVCYVLVDKSQLLEHGGQNYLSITDTAVFIGRGIETMSRVFCPGSKEEYLIRHQNKIQGSDESVFFDDISLLYSVRVVDNTSPNLPVYWCNVFNNAVAIKAMRDPSLADGIYITYRTNNQNSEEYSLDMDYHPIGERLKIAVPLHISKEEAMNTFVHPERIIRDEQVREQAARANKMEKDEELAREKLKAEKQRQQFEKERFEQEEKATRRKNTFDLIKYGPMIINAVIVLVTLIISFVTKAPIRPVKI